MSNANIRIKKDNPWLSILLMLALICLAYSNTLTSSWHLDDVINILSNTRLHLNDLSFSNLIKTFFAYPEQPGRFYRPISCLSLALNWYFGQDNTFGYHFINIAIHLLTGFFLFKTILVLLDSPRLKGRYQGQEQFIAILATIFWAVNPIQTQAITYIVQRMASMSALFYVLGIYFYVQGRLITANRKERILYFLLMTFSFLFALGSKENSIIFPFSIFLTEIIFFSTLKISKKNIFILILAIATIVSLSVFLFVDGNISAILSSYQNRNFTLPQRLLTEARIVCWYLSLLFYPAVTRLSIEHDIQLSTSLFVPATTLPSMLFLMALCIFALWGYKKYPIPAFAILFFLLNHIVESTILPLELAFEHRNYLPSLFLFWPVAILIVQLLNNYRKQPVMHGILIAFFCLLISSLALGTYIRNQVWYTEKSLWSDAVKKAPNNMRAIMDLAYTYEYENDLQTAFHLYQKALGKSSPTRNKFTVIAYNNMGNIMRKMGRYQDALSWYKKGLIIDAGNEYILFNVFITQQSDGDQAGAKRTLDTLIQQSPQTSRYLIDYANIEIAEGNPEKAIKTLRKALAFSPAADPSLWQCLLSLSLASNKIHQFDKANFYIRLAKLRGAPDSLVGLCSLENHILRKSGTAADPILKTIFSSISLSQLHKKIIFGLDNTAEIALDKELILNFIADWIGNQGALMPTK